MEINDIIDNLAFFFIISNMFSIIYITYMTRIQKNIIQNNTMANLLLNT